MRHKKKLSNSFGKISNGGILLLFCIYYVYKNSSVSEFDIDEACGQPKAIIFDARLKTTILTHAAKVINSDACVNNVHVWLCALAAGLGGLMHAALGDAKRIMSNNC